MVLKTKVCSHCGHELPENEMICRYCFTKLEDNKYLTKNHGSYNYTIEKSFKKEIVPSQEEKANRFSEDTANNLKKAYSKVLPIRRFFILMVFTFGLYRYYWFYKNSKYTKEYGKNINPLFRTFLFIIPFVRWYIYYALLKDMRRLIESKGLDSFSVACNVLLYFFVPLLGFWSMINVQESMNEFWRVQHPNLLDRRSFTTNEKIVIGIFILIELLFIIAIISFIVIAINIYSFQMI